MTARTKYILFGILFLIFVGVWWTLVQIIQENQPLSSGLPYYGPDTTNAHKYLVRDFQFTDQNGKLVKRADFENKIWVTDFFFTTCDGICPIMSNSLSIIQDSFKNDTNVLILSHTVDPEYDNVDILREYANRYGVIDKKWRLVTGLKDSIYDYARTSYFVATPKDSSIGEDFVHSQLICLIDPHLHIRGYYDGTNQNDVNKLIQSIKWLEIEYEKIKGTI